MTQEWTEEKLWDWFKRKLKPRMADDFSDEDMEALLDDIRHTVKLTTYLKGNKELPKDSFYHSEGIVWLNDIGESGKESYKIAQQDMVKADFKSTKEWKE